MSEIPKGLEYNAKENYMVRMFHVYKGYIPNQWVLEDIDLDVKKGDYIVIAGPNGAGKSTLTNLIAGQDLADRGEIIVNGRNISRLTGKNLQLFRQTLGVMSQDQGFFTTESLYQNLAPILLAHGFPQKKVEKKVAEILSLVGLKDKITFLPRQLSKGEQRLTAFARSIIHNPVLLLADEPTDNLDPDNKLKVMSILEQLNQGGMTVIITTREKTFDRSGYQRLIQLEKGRIIGC